MPTIKIITSLCYFSIAILSLIVAKMSWGLYTSYANQVSMSKNTFEIAPQQTSVNQRGNIDTIIASQMFYVAPPQKKVVAVKKTAPVKVVAKTKLNLKLTGLITSDISVAVVIYNGQQRPYLLDEFIVNTDRLKVQLISVLDDHIIVENNGVKERLSLPKNNNQRQANTGIIKQS
jgi:type II secretory pathway component PulC